MYFHLKIFREMFRVVSFPNQAVTSEIASGSTARLALRTKYCVRLTWQGARYAVLVSRLGSTQNPQLASVPVPGVPVFYRSHHVNKLVAQARANNSHQIYASSSLLKRSQTPTQPLGKHSA